MMGDMTSQTRAFDPLRRAEGEDEAPLSFEGLFARIWPSEVRRMTRRYAALDEAALEDAVQTALMQVWERWNTLGQRPAALQIGYTLRVISSRIIDVLRRSQVMTRRGQTPADLETLHEVVAPQHERPDAVAETRDLVRRSMAAISLDRSRQAISLFAVGYSHREIGALFGTSEGAVKQLVWRATNQARQSVLSVTEGAA